MFGMAGKLRHRQLDPADWAGLFIEHLNGKSAAQIATERGLNAAYVATRLRAQRLRTQDDVTAQTRQAMWCQLNRVRAALETGHADEADRSANLLIKCLKVAREMGEIMTEKDTRNDGDKRAMDDMPDPRVELLERYNGLAAARDQKCLGAAPESRGGAEPSE